LLSDKDRQKLTKSRRTTVASSKPSEAGTTKLALSSSDVECLEVDADTRRGRKAGSRHDSKTAAAVASSTTTAVSFWWLCYFC